MLNNLKHRILNHKSEFINNRKSAAEAKEEKLNLNHILVSAPELTRNEKSEIKSIWGSIIAHISRGYDYYIATKQLWGFDAKFLPRCYYFPYIESVLNPPKWKYYLSHKSVTELLYSRYILQPETIIRTYGGTFFNKDYQQISSEEVCSILKRIEDPLLFKPAVESNQGSGIKLIEPEQLKSLCSEIVSGAIFKFASDFVLQTKVSQSEDTSRFNPSSLNCMRITTLNLNGDISVCSRAIKCGPIGSVVDNIGTGKKGVIVGIKPNGDLYSSGYYGNRQYANSHNDVIFKGCTIKYFNRVEEAAIKLHRAVPNCKVIGWDIALNKNNEPVLIEGNVVYPGISLEQMCTGPIFGERTEEVISYISAIIQK